LTQVYAVIAELEQEGFPVTAACHTLHIARSGYYSFKEGKMSPRQLEDQRLLSVIQNVFLRHRRRYGARRIAQELEKLGELCGVPRVSRLMKTRGLRAIQPKRFRPKTTNSQYDFGYSPNLLLHAPPPARCNQVWLADITYIPLQGGIFDYLALLMDLFSRKIVAWAMQDNMEESLVITALRSAIATRQPPRGLVHHSDRGGQYAGKEYRQLQQRAGAVSSMSRAANCYDNAFMESYIGTVKSELEMVEYEDRLTARKEISEYIAYYNNARIHSAIDYMTPVDFEIRQTKKGGRRRPK
jgi:transposase InsO family protein